MVKKALEVEMTEAEQEQICRAIAVSCMWGQGGIAAVILDRMDAKGPKMPTSWRAVYQSVAKDARRESVGVITDADELRHYLQRGYWLVNYDEDGCSLFNPAPMNGLAKYVSKELSDLQQAKADRWKVTMPSLRG